MSKEPKIVGVGSNPSPKSKKPQFSKQYDYRSNLEKLKKRYENKIEKLLEQLDYSSMDIGNYCTIEGLINSLETSIHDIEDILDGLDV